MISRGKQELGEKPAPVSLCLLQISVNVTLISVARSKYLAA
jgi:hypothetical protein